MTEVTRQSSLTDSSYDDTVQADPAPVPDGEGDVYEFPASFAQGRLWFLQQLAPDSPAYNIDTALRIGGPLDLLALEAACLALIVRHEVLRTTFGQQGGEPVQLVHPAPNTFPITTVDLATLDAETQQARVRELIDDAARTPFDLEHGPLLRLTAARVREDEHVLIVGTHHIVSDGWSLGIFVRELGALYAQAALATADRDPHVLIEAARLEPLPIQYADYSLWQREWLSGDELERQEQYWSAQLQGLLPTLSLPTDHPRPSVQTSAGATYRFTLSKELSQELNALGRRDGATLFMTLLAAYNVLLARHTGDEDIIVGSPIAGRTRSETEGLIGLFVNTLALRTDVSGDPTFRELLARVRNTMVEAYAHQDLPFDRLVHLLQPARDRSRTPVFQTMFDLQNARDGSGFATFGGLRASRVPVPAVTAKFDLQLSFSEGNGELSGLLLYNTDLFDEPTIVRLAEHMRVLLESIVANPDAQISKLSILPKQEYELVVRTWNATDRQYPADATLVSLLSTQAIRTPSALAVSMTKGKSVLKLSYAELDAKADTLARALRSNGVGVGTLVGVCMERSPDMVIALVAVLKAGGVYVPMDPEYPAERLAFMLEDANVPVLLTQKHVADGALAALPSGTASTARRLCVDTEWRDIAASAAVTTAPLPTVRPDDLAYMIYTSGSTGRPKGAVNAHRGIVNRLLWMQDEYRLTAADVVLQKTPFSFDVSVWEFFWPLLAGAKLVMAEPGGHKDPSYLAATIQSEKVTVMHFVPSMLRAFLDGPAAATCTSLRDVMCSGEALPYELQERFFSALPATRLHNLYGPTEAAVDVTYWECQRDDARRIVPIGRPVANTQIYILDASGCPTPVGVPGELHIAGVQVGRGYRGRPELTAEKFIPDPFRTGAGTMYKTGDRARWLPDGTIDYLGRLDGQVKLRGFRIELGEIEAVLGTSVHVHECAVVMRENSRGEPMLVAYYTPTRSPNDVGAEIPRVPATELRTHLRELLPEHMVPSAFVALDKLPLSPSGKLDRKALPAPETLADVDTRVYAAPRTTLEHELVHIWETLLNKRPIGIHDDFFEIGGHSLLAVQMLAEIERVRGRRLPLASLFEGATIERIAAIIESAVQTEGEPGVVVLQPEGTERPFVFLHGDVRGGGWYCRRLAPLLGENVPLIVLPTLRGGSPDAPMTIEEGAASHIVELRKVQPKGPYRLGGFCVGGLVAFEMARQLEAAGEVVDRVVVVDSTAGNALFKSIESFFPLIIGTGNPEQRLERRAKLIRKLHYYRSRVRHVWRMRHGEKLRWVRTNVARYLPLGSADPEVSSWPTAPAEFRARPATSVLIFQERAASAYIPGEYRGAMDVIWATEQFPVTVKFPARGWDQVSGTVRVHGVASSHVGLITYNIELLADALRACLGLNR